MWETGKFARFSHEANVLTLPQVRILWHSKQQRDVWFGRTLLSWRQQGENMKSFIQHEL